MWILSGVARALLGLPHRILRAIAGTQSDILVVQSVLYFFVLLGSQLGKVLLRLLSAFWSVYKPWSVRI